ncbi:MAG: hypothetical protein OEN49_01880 [Gammaproteobacteria bacterium]|nr:hypothetical protein [Gammaproteobacteria bacterium]MDH5487197.1 hypothetical protein [Gammaproteobacteria bacterium]
MDSLDRAIDLVSRWKDNRKKERAEVLERLEGVIKDCQAAAKVWQEYHNNPGKPGDHWTLVSWMGPERAKQLHEINLRAKASVEEVCRLAGPAAGRFVVLDDDVTEMAYRQLKPGESGIDAAKTALENLKARADYLRGLIERTQRGKSLASSKTASVKKSKKKSVNKSAKKKAPKKK